MLFHIRISDKATNRALVSAEHVQRQNKNQDDENRGDIPSKKSEAKLPHKTLHNQFYYL